MSEPTDEAPEGPRNPPWAAPASPGEVGPTPTSTPPWVRPEAPGVPGVPGVPGGFAGVPVPPTPPPMPATARPTPKGSKLPIIAIVVVLLVVAGIAAVIIRGSSDEKASSGGERTPEATVEAFSDAVASGDADTFCELLSEGQREILSRGLGGDCLDSVGAILGLAGALGSSDIEVKGSTIDGDRATVSVEVNGTAGEIPLVKEDGRWVIDSSPDALVRGPSGTGDGGTDGEAGDTGEPGGVAISAACAADLQTLEIAAEAYLVMNPEPATSAQQLVDAGLLRELPAGAAIGPDGTVVPAGNCA